MYFSENLPGVNPLVMNYKTRLNKNQPARYSLAWPDRFLLLFVMAEKWKNTSGYTRLYVRVQPWRKACSVCELARALVSHCRSINIATFSTQDLREQGYQYYVGSYQANKKFVIPRMFSHELRTSIKGVCKSFLPWMIPNIWYH